MDLERLHNLLSSLRDGGCSVDDAMRELRDMPYEDIGFANVDHHRPLRIGIPEVIYGEGKEVYQIIKIVDCIKNKGSNVLVTRVSKEKADALSSAFANGAYNSLARTFTLIQKEVLPNGVNIGVISAGSSDLPVAEEAVVTAELFGSKVSKYLDIGVAGLHRLLDRIDKIRESDVLIVVAGMEGALPSVIGGLVGVPIIAVPTSVGYGANFEGIAALLAMLNSCAAGITVVNIDNGFGAGYAASLMSRIKNENTSF